MSWLLCFFLCLLMVPTSGWGSSGEVFGGSVLGNEGHTKFLVILVQSGLGNRIQTIASSAILAYLMDRVLVIDCPMDHDCGSHLTDLFKEERAPHHSDHALLYHPENVYTPKGVTPQHLAQECIIDFTHDQGSFKDFWFLLSPNIYETVDLQCDIIKLHSNIKFTSLIENSRVFQTEKFSKKLSLLGEDPFGKMIRRLFNNPVDSIMNTIIKFKRDYGLTSRHRWMSLHSRGFYERDTKHNYTYTDRAIQCANSMLSHDLINKFFFATETTSLQEKVYSMVKPPGKLVYFAKELVNDSNNSHIDSFSLRGRPEMMKIAVTEWYLVGEAYYCSIGCERSTFSTTAIKRTDCIYLPYYQQGGCVSSVTKSSSEKPKTEFVLNSFWKEKESGFLEDPGLTHVGVGNFMATLKKEKKGITTAMTSQADSTVITDFWNR